MKEIEITQSEIMSIENLEKIEIFLNKILVDETKGSLAILLLENRKVVYLLPQNEGTVLTYVRTGCSKKPAMPTIYNHYIDAMKSLKFDLVCTVLEECVGDMYYATMHWRHKKSNIDTYRRCTFGDAIIMATMCDSKMYVLRKTMNELEPLSPRLQQMLEEGE